MTRVACQRGHILPTAALADHKQFAKLLRRLHRHDWGVYAKPAFGGPMQVLRYLRRGGLVRDKEDTQLHIGVGYIRQ
jgi:hypothetical protein